VGLSEIGNEIKMINDNKYSYNVSRNINIECLSSEEIKKLFYGLQIKQIKLEKENKELRDAALELDAARLYYYKLFNQSPVGYVTVDENDIITEINHTAAKLLNLSKSKLINQQFSDFIHKDDIDIYVAHRNSFNDILEKYSTRQLPDDSEDLGSLTCELYLSNTDRSMYCVLLKTTLSLDNDGNAVYHMVITDITQRKTAEIELKENLQYLEAVINTVMDGITLSDWYGNFEIFNSQMEGITGYTKEEANNDSFFIGKLYSTADKHRKIGETTKKLLEEGGVNFEETQITSKSGEVKSVLVATSQFLKNDKPYLLSVYHDITKRKEAEIALQDKEKLFSKFIKESPIYAFIKEVQPHESRVLFASNNFIDITEIPSFEMVGKTMEDLFPKEFAEKITSDDWNVITNKKIIKINEELNNRSYFTIKYPIVLSEKTLLAGYTIDITEDKIAEETIKNL